MASLVKTMIGEATAAYPGHHSASMVELRNGVLFAVWMRFVRSNLGANDHAPNHIVAAESHDGGLRWSEPRVIVEPLAGDVNVYNPCLLALPSGKLLLFYYRHLRLEWGKPFSTTAYLRRSQDDGRTFSEPAEMWNDRPQGSLNSSMIRLSTGRLILPMGETLIWGGPEDNQKTSCLISDDEGTTWRRSSALLRLPLRGAMEGNIAETADGTLVMAMRTQLGSPFIARSFDRGETWTKPQTSGLKSPESMPRLVRIPASGDLLLIWNDSEYDPAFDHRGRRSPLACAISRDRGETWERRGNLEDDPACEFTNPSCCFRRDGYAVIAYLSSPMANPDPPGKLGRSAISLKAAIVNPKWLA